MATKVNNNNNNNNNKPKKNTSQQRSNNEREGHKSNNGGFPYLRFVDALFFFMLAFSVESYYGDYFSTGKSCAHDRLKHGDYWHKSTSGLLLNFTVSVLVVLWVLVTSWPRTKHESWSLNWSSIYNVGFLLTWFYGTFCLCVLGKFLLRDDTCSQPGRFNSVSGHFNFHIYYLLSVAYAATKIRPQKHPLITDVFSPDMLFNFTKLRLRTKLFLVLYLVFLVSTFSSLYRTYSGGYHSLRQIFLGTLLAIASHRVSVSFLEKITLGKMSRLSGVVLALGSFGVALVSASTWARNPFSVLELVFMSLTILLFVYAYHQCEKKPKQQQPPSKNTAAKKTSPPAPKSSSSPTVSSSNRRKNSIDSPVTSSSPSGKVRQRKN